MEHDEIVRTDFPVAPDGYERRSVEAHLEAVAAAIAALEARIAAMTVERAALAEGADAPSEESEPANASVATASPADVEVAARLVALKLVLDGAPRDEVLASIEQEFSLDDPGGLVDEVIAKAG